MWEPILTRLSPYMATIRLVAGIMVLCAAFAAGWRVESWRWDAANAASLQKENEKLTAQIAANATLTTQLNQVSAQLTQKNQEYDDVFRKYQSELHEATTGGRCYGPAAIELFNRAIRSVSDPAGNSRQPAGDASGAGATDTDVLDNALHNLELYGKAREQVKAIRDANDKIKAFNKEWYGK